MPDTREPVLVVEDLHVTASQGSGEVTLVDGVSFSVRAGEMLALVGESGCGKSMTALALLDLLPKPQVRISSGRIRVADQEVQTLSAEALRGIRGREIAMVFQEPTTSLNPVLTIGAQLVEAIQAHRTVGKADAMKQARELLARVQLPDPDAVLAAYPHRLSGGMCQRAMIAIALAGHPKVLVADEPTTALDVTVQAQILELIAGLQQEQGLAVLLITHDLGLVAGYADRVAVMYAGRIVESADVETIFAQRLHPYTDDLLQAAPHFVEESVIERKPFREIPGQVPPPGRWPQGCHFEPRCRLSTAQCRGTKPSLIERGSGHQLACLLGEVAA